MLKEASVWLSWGSGLSELFLHIYAAIFGVLFFCPCIFWFLDIRWKTQFHVLCFESRLNEEEKGDTSNICHFLEAAELFINSPGDFCLYLIE